MTVLEPSEAFTYDPWDPDVLADPHVQARQSILEVDGVPMQGLIARLSATPGAIRGAGRPRNADPDASWLPRP